MTANDQYYLYFIMFSFSLAIIIYFVVEGFSNKKWEIIKFSLILIIGNLIYSSGYYIMAEYKTKNSLAKINHFITECNDKYDVKVFNDDYQFICEKGSYTVSSKVFNQFNKSIITNK